MFPYLLKVCHKQNRHAMCQNLQDLAKRIKFRFYGPPFPEDKNTVKGMKIRGFHGNSSSSASCFRQHCGMGVRQVK
jgi:hypothetical protein